MVGVALLKNMIQEYAWGSGTFIQSLLGKSGLLRKPAAEMWMGIHPSGPSMVLRDGAWIPLLDFINSDPERILGDAVARKFSRKLPFLFKVLAAARPLSIQAHPNQDQAIEGFQKEENLGVPLKAPERNYRDRSHKPEIFCALRPFWALKGFRKPEEILALMERSRITSALASLEPLLGKIREGDMKSLFSALLRLSKENQSLIISKTVKSLRSGTPDDPAFAWVIRLHRAFPHDIMALCPLFLNLVRLEPGEAMEIHAGTLHAYLQGAGIELMANSDNVLRAGLTSKHTDPDELLRIVNFDHGEVSILKGKKLRGGERIYPGQAEEFALSMVSVRKGAPYVSRTVRSVEIMICVKGRGQITDVSSGDLILFHRGVSFIVPAMVNQYRIDGSATIYKATVPMA